MAESGSNLELRKAAANPQRVTVDGTTVTQHPLRDQIALEEHLSEKESKKSRRLPIRLAKIRPGGAI